MTLTYPDIGRFVKDHFKHIESFILDSEIVAVDIVKNKILPF
jgi:DNA ligase-1